MKRIIAQMLIVALPLASALADTALKITGQTFACWQDVVLYPNPPSQSNSFSLTGVSGTGTFQSSMPGGPAPIVGPPLYGSFFNYTIDLNQMSPAANHCIKLLIHFGTPEGCTQGQVFGNPSAFASATLAPYGDVTFVFAGGCLVPGQSAVSFSMISVASPKTNYVTVIDDYTDPASGLTNETRTKIAAVVPDVPPNWAYAPPPIPNVFFQGDLSLVGTNQTNTNPLPVSSGPYDFTVQVLNAPSNGFSSSLIFTQTVQVVNGLFNLALPFDPISIDWGDRWLNVGVRPSGVGGAFSPLTPPLHLTPAPQALYAYSAGTVADLTPGQAVTSLDGLTDGVLLQSGFGIVLGTNGNVLTISAQPGVVSDRNVKTDFATIQSQDILAKLAALPIQTWRYTNEVASVHHLGPTAQDFKAAFGLGTSDTSIGIVDEGGVALAAIQGLNRKLEERERSFTARLQQKAAEIEQLQKSVAALEAIISGLKQGAGAGLAPEPQGR